MNMQILKFLKSSDMDLYCLLYLFENANHTFEQRIHVTLKSIDHTDETYLPKGCSIVSMLDYWNHK